jgi:hypothetical protein
MSPLSSGSKKTKQETNVKAGGKQSVLDLFFSPADESGMFVRNVG